MQAIITLILSVPSLHAPASALSLRSAGRAPIRMGCRLTDALDGTPRLVKRMSRGTALPLSLPLAAGTLTLPSAASALTSDEVWFELNRPPIILSPFEITPIGYLLLGAYLAYVLWQARALKSAHTSPASHRASPSSARPPRCACLKHRSSRP